MNNIRITAESADETDFTQFFFLYNNRVSNSISF